MRRLKVGLAPERGCVDVYHTAKTTYEGEITELVFSDGHKVKAITVACRKPDCSGCYIREYSFNMGMQPVCPRDPVGGALICVPCAHICTDLKDVYCVFKPLDNLVEDI